MCSAHHHRSSPTINKQLLIERVDIYCVSRINKEVRINRMNLLKATNPYDNEAFAETYSGGDADYPMALPPRSPVRAPLMIA